MLRNRIMALLRRSVTGGLCLIIPVLALTFGIRSARAACDCPHVGDADADGQVNVTDMVHVMDHILVGGPAEQDPGCPTLRVDMNADGVVDARDVAAIRYYLFAGGPLVQDPCECETNPQLCDEVTDPTPGEPGNSVVVESRSIIVGATGARIAISLTNDVTLQGVVVPLVAREITPGAFITLAQLTFEDRLASVPPEIHYFNQYATQDGACPGGFGTVTFPQSGGPNAVAASPEGFLFFRQTLSSNMLAPGTDATGSMILTVDVTSVEGTFEIDTTCLDPYTHLMFIQNDPPTNTPIVPSFTKGVITLVPNAQPVALCQDVTVSVDNSCTDVDVSIDNGSYDPDGGPVTLTQVPPGPYPLGTTLVTLTVEDQVGDFSQCQATVTVEDTTPPEITCPDDIFLNIPPIYSGWVVAYDVTATDNCPGGVTIESTNPSGGFFPNGVTEVICTATDASGNTAECSFFVTIDAVCYDRLSDVNCDGQTDALDLAMIIDILFAGGGPAPPCSNGPQ